MQVIEVSLGERSYPVCVGRNLYPLLAETWTERVRPGTAMLVSDEHVFPLYGGKLMNELELAGFRVFPAVVPAGEESKSLARADMLYNAAIKAGLDRGGLIIALGGGVIGDLAGFVAATYLRGVPFIQIPTTLLAQVDSSVGGKTAVNHPLGKNLVGAFYQPRLVWIELETLDTLPEREFRAGLAEVIKYGVIRSEPFFTFLEEKWAALLARNPAVLGEVITACCRIKADVVAEDEREEGLRAILNFGHTLGHALEAATSYRHYLHGEAVLVGMALATRLAVAKGILAEGHAERMLALLARVGFRDAPERLDCGRVLSLLKNDKKREGSLTVFVLPVRIGEVALFRDVEPSLVRGVLTGYLD